MWPNRPLSEMTASNSPPAALLTQPVLFHRSRCWFCFSKPMKSAWSGVSLKLLEHYKHFFWSSLMFSPFLLFSLVPLFTSLPILASFCFRSGNVFAEGVSPESLGHSSWDVSQQLLATVLRSQWPCEEPAPYSEWHKASSAFNRTSNEMRTMSVTQERSDIEREPDRQRQWVYWAHDPNALLF